MDSIGTNAICEYSGSTGAFLSTFVAAGSGGLNAPAGMVFGQDGNLYVSSTGTQSVDRFEGPAGPAPGSPLPAAGQSGATFVAAGSGGLAGPNGADFRPERKPVRRQPQPSGHHQRQLGVLEFDGTTGSFHHDLRWHQAPMVFRIRAGWPSIRMAGSTSRTGTNAIHRYDSQGNYLDDPVTAGAASASSLSALRNGLQRPGSAAGQQPQTATSVVQYNSGVVVTLSAASTSPVTVQYATSDGTAVAGTDYTAQTGTVTFAPGQTSRLILLVTLYDATPARQ